MFTGEKEQKKESISIEEYLERIKERQNNEMYELLMTREAQRAGA
ncbi:hypothetical protein M2145_002160 [Lachnospiraceae bacterium PF1-21]|nr:hypothetical protein [Ohessyouella blattaphilus]